MDKIELNTDVSEASWIEEDESWEVTLTHMAAGSGDWSEKDRQLRISQHGEQSVYVKRETVRARVVISAVGALVEPRGWPESIPGRESFEGDIFHSARWNYDVDLAAKDVIAVGTGCSAAQFVPRLTKPPFNAKSVTQLMRSPPWVVPRLKPPFGEEKWERYSPTIMSRIPLLQRALRTSIFLFAELEFLRTFLNRPYNIESRKKTESKLLAHMMKTVPEKYHEILTPDYGVGCKRKIFDAAWFPALNDPRIHLTTQPLASIQPKSVTLGPGQTYPSLDASKSKIPREEVKLPADVIVLANGFDVTTWLHPLKVRGKSQKLLHDVWDERGGPQAYMGSAMDGFPNFFIVFGPNTATGHSSVVLAIENMVEHTLKFLKPILKGDVRTCEVKKEAEVAWARDIQTKLKDTVFMAESCTSWYKTESGWNSITYPYQASS
ncbi:hypothetical protein MMC20_003613 [Loxospora ochrophaea]|nr:hypothetical protein [Loxospora ochrophaea]